MKRLLTFTSAILCCALFFMEQAGGEAPDNSSKAHSMKRQIIRIPDAPSSPLYSQAVKVGGTIYVTGVPGIDPKTNKVAGPTIQEQTRQALLTCENILRAAGAKLTDVVEVQVLLARPRGFRRSERGVREVLSDRSAGSLRHAARPRSRRASWSRSR